ncbi:putative U1 small nuclear ribonucleoprotein C [Penaeus vannamei]|uniref:U1 small nuclear ribonucleoprotein C n=1 Tax=Penaeus vannamei TaxID=6689 RepID=A0A423U3Q7_PENVA|nr:U1 small nuclear ribonucleoprotein C-like isoform X2 [Penaeus vannamei]ROT83331.1 putative U1 small nuclear ribonucleoprotein C [Penaeus vannamei]
MPKYYCDYCDTYLTHDSPSVRKTHCQGRKHKENVKIYYQKWMEEQAQNLIDATTAAFKAGKIPKGAAIPPPNNMQAGGGPAGPGGLEVLVVQEGQVGHRTWVAQEVHPEVLAWGIWVLQA